MLAFGSLSASSSSVRSSVSGVRSSCEALATNCRCASKDVSRRASSPSTVVAELLQLVVGPVEVEPAVEVARGDVAGGLGDRAQRAQCAAGDHPAEPEREHGHQRERDRGVEEQLVQRSVRLPLRRCDRDLRGGCERFRAHRHREDGCCAFVVIFPLLLWKWTTACWPELMKKLPVYWWWTST